MTHDHALILVSRMSFYCGLKNSQSLSMLLKVTEFGSNAQRVTASHALCSTALPTVRGALSHIASLLALPAAGTPSAPAT